MTIRVNLYSFFFVNKVGLTDHMNTPSFLGFGSFNKQTCFNDIFDRPFAFRPFFHLIRPLEEVQEGLREVEVRQEVVRLLEPVQELLEPLDRPCLLLGSEQ